MMVENRPRIKPRINEWMTLYSFIREKFVDGIEAWLASLRQLQAATEDELRRRRTLLPSVLDKVFKDEL